LHVGQVKVVKALLSSFDVDNPFLIEVITEELVKDFPQLGHLGKITVFVEEFTLLKYSC